MSMQKSPPEVTVKWFDKDVNVPPQARDLLENYSHVSSEEVEKTVIELRDKAWEVWPYPCIGQFRFLELNLAGRTGLYERLVARLKAGDTFLDVGCCLGQDIRKLAYDGVPGDNLAGAELNGGFIDLGYELFRDKETLSARFIVANILEEDGPLREYHGQFDVVQLGMILHLFSWEEQVQAFAHAAKLLKADKPGTSVIGQATGHLDGIKTGTWQKQTFKHNGETFKKLIEEVSAKTGIQWEVRQAQLDTGLSIFDGKRTWDDPKTRRLLFEIQRV
ncbi:hypothetical protein GQ53DRAFT_205443 [Thozetella sp. PMI_491]|nr:hypothetical protein GQ53DRAFT_205443 [Thozetella sp. PMI_491]